MHFHIANNKCDQRLGIEATILYQLISSHEDSLGVVSHSHTRAEGDGSQLPRDIDPYKKHVAAHII